MVMLIILRTKSILFMLIWQTLYHLSQQWEYLRLMKYITLLHSHSLQQAGISQFLQLTSMHLVLQICLKQLEQLILRLVSIRLQHQRCLVRYRLYHRMRTHHSILVHHMELLSSMVTGLQRTIVKVSDSLLVQVFFSTTKVKEEVLSS